MQLISPAFTEGGKIPSEYTCDGKNINPPLDIRGVPDGTESLALIMDDPDVPLSIRPDGLYIHWVVYNMPATLKSIEKGKAPKGVFGAGTGGKLAYQGPCPPDREHRYFFKLYALDISLDLPAGATKEEVEEAIEGHVIEEAHLMGRYERAPR